MAFGTTCYPISNTNQISEVRNYFAEHKKQYEDQAVKVNATKYPAGVYNGPAFLFGGRSVPQLPELLTSLPGRDAVDKMVARYFNDYDPAIRELETILISLVVTYHLVDILHPASWRRTVRTVAKLSSALAGRMRWT